MSRTKAILTTLATATVTILILYLVATLTGHW